MAAHHHLGLLLVALLYVCAFSGVLLVAASLALLASLAGAVLATLALTASDARRLAALAARVAGLAAADLRLARAVAEYAVVKAAVCVALVLRPKVGAPGASSGPAALRRGEGGSGFAVLQSSALGCCSIA